MTTPAIRADAARRASERTIKRSKAIAAAAGFGGFASLVAVLIAHPYHATSASTTVRGNTTTSSRSATASFSTTTTMTVPDTATSAS
jgi:hypothetical protein